jgi:tRNA(fMet)-specific endonuclease VapC
MATTRLCVDTGLLIAFLKGREPGASALAKAVRELDCCITSITAYEMIFGVARAKKEIGEAALLSTLTVLPFGSREAERAAYLHDELIRRNQDIGIKDVLIAAICLQHDVTLLTFNKSHFARVPGLRILEPETFLKGA